MRYLASLLLILFSAHLSASFPVPDGTGGGASPTSSKQKMDFARKKQNDDDDSDDSDVSTSEISSDDTDVSQYDTDDSIEYSDDDEQVQSKEFTVTFNLACTGVDCNALIKADVARALNLDAAGAARILVVPVKTEADTYTAKVVILNSADATAPTPAQLADALVANSAALKTGAAFSNLAAGSAITANTITNYSSGSSNKKKDEKKDSTKNS